MTIFLWFFAGWQRLVDPNLRGQWHRFGLPPKGDLWDWTEAGGSRQGIKSTGHPEADAEGHRKRRPPDRQIRRRTSILLVIPEMARRGGRRWAVDDKGAVRRLAKRTILAYLEEATLADNNDHTSFALSSLDARRIANLLTMVECELVITPDQLDTHPFLLNFLNGTLDLRTGELLPHNPNHFITKMVRYNYNRHAGCPLFLTVIARMMGNHPDASEPDLERAERMVGYLQRALGYSLTGTTEEKAVFVPFGKGNKGKTTLLSTFLLLLEEYSYCSRWTH